MKILNLFLAIFAIIASLALCSPADARGYHCRTSVHERGGRHASVSVNNGCGGGGPAVFQSSGCQGPVAGYSSGGCNGGGYSVSYAMPMTYQASGCQGGGYTQPVAPVTPRSNTEDDAPKPQVAAPQAPVHYSCPVYNYPQYGYSCPSCPGGVCFRN